MNSFCPSGCLDTKLYIIGIRSLAVNSSFSSLNQLGGHLIHPAACHAESSAPLDWEDEKVKKERSLVSSGVYHYRFYKFILTILLWQFRRLKLMKSLKNRETGLKFFFVEWSIVTPVAQSAVWPFLQQLLKISVKPLKFWVLNF